MKKKKINFKKIIKKAKKLLFFFGERSFLPLLIFFAISLIISGFVFYNYFLSVQKGDIEIVGGESGFQVKKYQEVIGIIDSNREDFEKAKSKNYINIFEKVIKEESVPIEGGEDSSGEDSQDSQEKESEGQKNEEEDQKDQSGQEGISYSKKNFLLGAETLFDFYMISQGNLPSIKSRANIWEEEGLGAADGYHGFSYQNILLLNALKRQLTEE